MPALFDTTELDAIIQVWRDASADIQSQADQIRRAILAELGPGSRVRRSRLRLQVERLEELQGTIESILDDLMADTDVFLNGPPLASIYGHGAASVGAAVGVPFAFNRPHRAALEVLAADSFDDLLRATRYVDRDAKRFVQRVSKRLTQLRLIDGDNSKRRLATAIEREFSARGIGKIRYRDGSRREIGDYADMVLRTKGTIAHNSGSVNMGRLMRVEFYEVFDGEDCGLTAHNDPVKANQRIVPLAMAIAYPLSHPRCVRAISARPDLTRATLSEAVGSQPPERRDDQRAFEIARGQDLRSRRARRQRRARRARRTPARSGR